MQPSQGSAANSQNATDITKILDKVHESRSGGTIGRDSGTRLYVFVDKDGKIGQTDDKSKASSINRVNTILKKRFSGEGGTEMNGVKRALSRLNRDTHSALNETLWGRIKYAIFSRLFLNKKPIQMNPTVNNLETKSKYSELKDTDRDYGKTTKGDGVEIPRGYQKKLEQEAMFSEKAMLSNSTQVAAQKANVQKIKDLQGEINALSKDSPEIKSKNEDMIHYLGQIPSEEISQNLVEEAFMKDLKDILTANKLSNSFTPFANAKDFISGVISKNLTKACTEKLPFDEFRENVKRDIAANTMTLVFDRELFKDIVGRGTYIDESDNRKRYQIDKGQGKPSNLFFAPGVDELVKPYVDGTWKEGEEKQITFAPLSFGDTPEDQDKHKTLMQTVTTNIVSSGTFERVFNELMRS